MKKTDVVIIGAGPVGLFAVHQLGIKGLKAVVVDNLDKAGGQCIELYPDKPIYDIPAVPECTGEELTKNLIEQIKPFNTEFFYNERVDEVKQDKDNWIVKTNNNNEFTAPNIIIAGGVGSFEPRKLSTKDTEKYEGKSIFYAVKNKDEFKNKNISIFGGGDSALDWTLELSKFSKITLIHRRNEFRGALDSVEKVQELKNKGLVNLVTPAEVTSILGHNHVTGVTVKKSSDSDEEFNLMCDHFIPLFGLSPKLGPIANWGLNIEKNAIKVNNSLDYQTNIPGVFAIGDVNTYPGKLKLILCGFHEATLMCQAAYRIINPGKKYVLKYTTVSGINGFDGTRKEAPKAVVKKIE